MRQIGALKKFKLQKILHFRVNRPTLHYDLPKINPSLFPLWKVRDWSKVNTVNNETFDIHLKSTRRHPPVTEYLECQRLVQKLFLAMARLISVVSTRFQQFNWWNAVCNEFFAWSCFSFTTRVRDQSFHSFYHCLCFQLQSLVLLRYLQIVAVIVHHVFSRLSSVFILWYSFSCSY